MTKFFTTFYIHNDNILRMVFSSLRALALGLLGLCFSSVSFAQSGYSLELEVLATHTEGELAGMTTYGLFLNMVHPTDFLSSCSGDDNNPMVMTSSTGTWYNNALNANWTAAGLNPLLFGAFPELVFDSFLTIGSVNSDEGPFPQSVSSEVNFTAEFTGPGPGQNFVVDDGLGGAWFLTFPGLEAADTHPAFAGDDLKVLVAQFTTNGEMSGQLQIQVFREGVQTNEYRELLPWCADVEACGLGCTDPMAENYDAEAVYNDGTCEYVTASEGAPTTLPATTTPKRRLTTARASMPRNSSIATATALRTSIATGPAGATPRRMPLVFVGAIARWTRTPMACAMTWTNASARTTLWACATGV